jgi:YfiH family protein
MLPQRNDGFAWVQASGRPMLVCEALEPIARHFFTTREWRLGSAPPETREAAWADVAASAGVAQNDLIRRRQVHGAQVSVHAAGARTDPHPSEADIIISADTGTTLAIQTADCVPLLLADRRTGAIAAAHAGWRGMAARVPQVAIEALAREFGARPGDLIAVLGPSIGACCYEVGADVRHAFTAAGFSAAELSRWFFDAPQPIAGNPSMPGLRAAPRPDHWFFDGWAATSDQLTRAGVPAAQIHVAGLCTASHPSLCSYRRDGASAGRMAAAIRPTGASRLTQEFR